MIGIIGAMDIEVESIKSFLTGKKETNISGIDFVSGKYDSKEVVVAKCGPGKVFAGLCAEAMILKYAPELIINIGVAGALDKSLKMGEIVIADAVCQYDVDTSAVGDPVGMISDIDTIKFPADTQAIFELQESVKSCKINYCIGTIASGDQFVADDEKKQFISRTFGAKSCEMEGGAVGHVCYVNNVPFAVLRAMSDQADGKAAMSYSEFKKSAAKNSTKVIKKFLEIR